jgi:clan AA aspartic protease
MNGIVESAGRALIEVDLHPALNATLIRLLVWIDTGFTGDLVLPQALVDEMALTMTGSVSAVLADGSEVAMPAYRCFVQWFGELRRLEVVANEGNHALLGVGMLLDRDLRIDYRAKLVNID